MIPAVGASFPAMRSSDLDAVRRLENEMLALDQVEIPTHHAIHAGMYARTIRIPAGVQLTGALIKRATLLIFNGRATVYVGGGCVELAGYHVIAASAGRKQAFLAHEDCDLTMIFPTEATTVAQAEAEFTDELEMLMSRRDSAHDTAIITGEY